MVHGRIIPFALLDAWAALAPTQCSGCGVPDRSLCGDCRLALLPMVHPVCRAEVRGWAALDYAGAVRNILGAYKDGGRTDAARALSAPLHAAILAALAHGPPTPGGVGGVHLVVVPSSSHAWRVRGFHPVELLLHHAGLRPTRVLAQVSQSRDQVGLGRDARSVNKRGSLAARRTLDGLRCLLVDDILTTGATLLEARRAVLAAGGEVAGVAVLAETRRRGEGSPGSQETHRQDL